MRHIVLSLSLVLVGCGGPKIDDTPNQMNQESTYAPGPYGYALNSTIENIKFVGKVDPAGAAGSSTYDTLPMTEFDLGKYYADKDVKYVVMAAVAGWCGPCNEEQMYVPGLQNTFEPKGFRFLEAMMQGYNARTGAPATEADINRWQSAHDIHVAMGLDPEGKLFSFADVSAFPLNLIVRTSDMKIVYMQVGLQDLTKTLSALP